jgi:glycosyltransferase involved in cell wall biosynthesis
MVGRLIPQKGPLFSLRSFARTLQYHPDAVLEIIGDGPLRSELEAEADNLGVNGHVYFHGPQPHDFVRSRLQVAEVLIQHCVTTPGGGVESLGLSILEAMACELPVVSTRHGAIMETVQHGVTGLLVEERDVEAMAQAIVGLLDDPGRAATIGAAARQRVLTHYSQDRARDRLRAIMGLPAWQPIRTEAALSPSVSRC